MTRRNDEGGAAATMEEALEGVETEVLGGGFAARWEPEKAGEYVIGEYQGIEEAQDKGDKFNVHTIAVTQWLGTFSRAKAPTMLTFGEIVAVTGAVLDRALAKSKAGDKIAVKYLGLGAKKGKKSQAKLFEVRRLKK